MKLPKWSKTIKEQIHQKLQGTAGTGAVKKLRSRSGETLAETIIALLLGALALVMLAGAIAAGSNSILKSKNKLDAYYSKNEELVNVTGTSTTTVDISSTGSNPSLDVTISGVTYTENDEFSKNPVVVYKK